MTARADAARAARLEASERRRRAGTVTPALWKALMERDGGKCRDCGTTEDLQADHVVPVARGGKTILSNLVLRCAHDNASRGDLTRAEARTCTRCERQFRRTRKLQAHWDDLCTPCVKSGYAKLRRLADAVQRERASAWKRDKAREYRQAAKARNRRMEGRP